MSVKPIQLYGARGEKLAPSWQGRGSNALIAAATQTTDRKQIANLDQDVHRTVTNYGRRTLLGLGRWVYANFPPVRGAVDEMAEFSSSSFFPQFWGADQEWGRVSEALLESHDRIIDVAGPPYSTRVYRLNLVRSILRDGDMLTVLVKTESGWPQIQCIPGHRIGGLINQSDVVEDGPYKGFRIIDGVIVGDWNTVLAYRVNTGDDYARNQFIDIPASDCFLSFVPSYVGQLRGISPLGSSVHHFQDILETDGFERLAQKLGASIGLIERNPLGEADPENLPGDGQPADAGTTSTDVIARENVTEGGVTVRYFQSGDPSSGLESLKLERPTASQQAFRASMMRDAFAGLGWSMDFTHDATKIGGASMRVVVDKINRTIRSLQDLILEPAMMRIDGYRVASFISRGDLPKNPDWWKWTYQGPARITADRRYDSDVDEQENQSGFKTRRKICAERGDYIDDVDAENAKDADNKWKAAADRVKFVAALGHEITIETAYNALWSKQPQGILPSQQAQPEPEKEEPSTP